MRHFLIFGLPLDVNGVRYANVLDRKQEQKDILGEFQNKVAEDFETYQ